MNELRQAAEMLLEVFDNDYGQMAKDIAIADLRRALNDREESSISKFLKFHNFVWVNGGGDIPYMKLSDDVGGLTMVSRWVRTSLLTDVPDDMSMAEAVLGNPTKRKS